MRDSSHPSMIFYLMNPGMAIIEFLGVGSPKRIHLEIDSNKTIEESAYILCPHCSYLHPGSTWSKKNKTVFKNWFGLYCHKCSGIIPCLRNYTSQLILWLTYPLWFWWVDRWKRNWLQKQPERYANINTEYIGYKKSNWWKAGAIWGLLMYMVMTPLTPLITNQPFRIEFALISIQVYAFGGLLFGLGMKLMMLKKSGKRSD